MLQNFNNIWEDPSYNRAQNPDRRTVLELLPIGVTWISAGNSIVRMFQRRGKGVVLTNGTYIAIVETDLGTNTDAYVICESNKILRRFKVDHDRKNFFDVYYVNGNLTFFYNKDNRDYSLVVEEPSLQESEFLAERY